MLKIKLKRTEYVVAAYAKVASGPGYLNTPVWVVIGDGSTGKLREECIQPADQPVALRQTFTVFAAAHSTLLGLVESQCITKSKS